MTQEEDPIIIFTEEEETCHQLRMRGNEWFKKKNYTEALECYSTAIEMTTEIMASKRQEKENPNGE